MVATEAASQGGFLAEAALIGTIVGAFVGLVQAILGWFKQRRESKIARAKFGYELIDALFANQFVLKFMEGIDTSFDIEDSKGFKLFAFEFLTKNHKPPATALIGCYFTSTAWSTLFGPNSPILK